MKQNAGNTSGKYAKWEDAFATVGIFLGGLLLAFTLDKALGSGIVSLAALALAIVACYRTANKKAPSPQQRLEQLEELKRSGSLTEEEYAGKRREILNDL